MDETIPTQINPTPTPTEPVVTAPMAEQPSPAPVSDPIVATPEPAPSSVIPPNPPVELPPSAPEAKTEEVPNAWEPKADNPNQEEQYTTDQLHQIDINLIKPNPWQPRKVFKDEHLDELAASIKEHGILQPLVVMPGPHGTYQLLVGERRLRASKIVGLATVPAIVRDAVTEQRKLELALIENIQRHNLDPIEEATAYQQLMEAYNLTQEQVAQKMGKKRTTVANTLRLLNLPLKIQRAIAEGIISEGHGRAILGVVGMEKQLALFDMVVAENMTVRQVEDKAREIMQRPKMVKAPKSSSDPETAALENELRGKLGTKVKVQKSGESGKIMIEFFSKEELDTFLERVSKLQ